MKLLILLSFVFFASDGGLAAYARHLRMSKADENLSKYVAECVEQVERKYLDPKDITNNIKTEDQIEEVAKDISLCIFHKTGIVDLDGKFHADTAKQVLSSYGLKEDEATAVLKKCTAVTRRDEKSSAYEIFKCIAQVDALGGAWV